MTNTATLASDTQLPELGENEFLLFKPRGLRCWSRQPEQTATVATLDKLLYVHVKGREGYSLQCRS